MQTTNFGFFDAHDAKLVNLGGLAERYFRDDPSTCLFKLRQFCEFYLMLSNPPYGNGSKGAANLLPACPAKAVE